MSNNLPKFVESTCSRRRFNRVIGAALGAGSLSPVYVPINILSATPNTPGLSVQGRPRAKQCIMIFLFGGPSQIDTWDMKPQSPMEFRGEFHPIATTVPGIEFCEHLPRTARWAHRLAVIRSLTMTGRSIGDHHADTYYILTGHQPDTSFFAEGINRKPLEGDWPFIGSAAASRQHNPHGLPNVVQLPALSGEVTNYINPGQFAGRLGPAWEPLLVRGEIDKPRELRVPAFQMPPDVSMDRFARRHALLQEIDDWQQSLEQSSKSVDDLQVHQQRALSLLTSTKSKAAFDIHLEPETTRARYGEDINAQSFLMARRLIEAGVPFVCVHWIGRRVGAGLSWDTHSDNFGQLKNVLLPAFDAGFSALMEDLEQRGLLEETLVVVTAEMGRTPKVGDPRTGGKGPPGRDHWIHCQTALVAGGGIQGQIYGASDRVAGYPADRPVYPEDIAATVFHALDIDPRSPLTDREGRTQSLLADGNPLPIF